jgi:peptidoglycan/LPS O-acetylase OafA/YrhL
MKKILTVLVAAALSGVAVVATSSSADARWGWGWGYGGGWGYRGVGCCGGGWGYRGLGWGPGGFAAGAFVGAALATPYYYYPVPAYPAYGVGSGCCY